MVVTRIEASDVALASDTAGEYGNVEETAAYTHVSSALRGEIRADSREPVN